MSGVTGYFCTCSSGEDAESRTFGRVTGFGVRSTEYVVRSVEVIALMSYYGQVYLLFFLTVK